VSSVVERAFSWGPLGNARGHAWGGGGALLLCLPFRGEVGAKKQTNFVRTG
jgi:hypothetical protein